MTINIRPATLLEAHAEIYYELDRHIAAGLGPVALDDLLGAAIRVGRDEVWLRTLLQSLVEMCWLAFDPDECLYAVTDREAIRECAQATRRHLMSDDEAIPIWLPGAASPAAAAMTQLSGLALALARQTRIPAVMLTVEPDLTVPVHSERTGDCRDVLVLTVDEALLVGDTTSRDVQAAAGAMAHEILCHAIPPGSIARGATAATGLAAVAGLIAAVFASWLVVPAMVVMVGAWLIAQWLQRLEHLEIDAAAAEMLTAAGLDGRSCMRAMLGRVNERESQWFRLAGWLASPVPPAVARYEALPEADSTRALQSEASHA